MSDLQSSKISTTRVARHRVHPCVVLIVGYCEVHRSVSIRVYPSYPMCSAFPYLKSVSPSFMSPSSPTPHLVIPSFFLSRPTHSPRFTQTTQLASYHCESVQRPVLHCSLTSFSSSASSPLCWILTEFYSLTHRVTVSTFSHRTSPTYTTSIMTS